VDFALPAHPAVAAALAIITNRARSFWQRIGASLPTDSRRFLGPV
jgi:hypothetical protein